MMYLPLIRGINMKKVYILSVCGLISLMLFSMIPQQVAAETMPSWLPKETDLTDYTLLWNGSDSFDNFICSDQANISIYNQIWYKNVTANQTSAVIAQAYLDIGSKVFDEELEIDNSTRWIFDLTFPDFDGTTRWDFFVYIIDKIGKTADITAELGWDHAIELNSTGLFSYLICGTIGTKLVISYALELKSTWFLYSDLLIATAMAGLVTGFIGFMALFTTWGAECPSPSAAGGDVIPTAVQQTTSRDDMIAFNKEVGETIGGGSIDGVSPIFVALIASVTIMIIIKKRK